MGNKYTKLGKFNDEDLQPFLFKGLKNYKIFNVCPVCNRKKFNDKSTRVTTIIYFK